MSHELELDVPPSCVEELMTAAQLDVLEAVVSLVDGPFDEPVALPRFARDFPVKMPMTDHLSRALQERLLPARTVVGQPRGVTTG